jgi:hypothetical protein
VLGRHIAREDGLGEEPNDVDAASPFLPAAEPTRRLLEEHTPDTGVLSEPDCSLAHAWVRNQLYGAPPRPWAGEQLHGDGPLLTQGVCLLLVVPARLGLVCLLYVVGLEEGQSRCTLDQQLRAKRRGLHTYVKYIIPLLFLAMYPNSTFSTEDNFCFVFICAF